MSNDNNNHNQNSNNSHHSRTYQRRRYHHRATTTRRLRLSWSTWSLMVSIFVWSLVHLVYLPPKLQWEWSRMVRWREEEDTNANMAAWWMNQRHNDHNHTAAAAAAIVARTQRTQHTNRIHHRQRGVEDVLEGCDYAHSWQRTSFPTCNVLHELDMGQTLPVSSSRRRRPQRQRQRQRQRLLMNHQDESPSVQEQQDSNINHTNSNSSNSFPGRYMGSGLWRDVFAIGSTSPLVSSSSDDRFVLKLFKMEHYDDHDDFSFSSSSRQQMHRNVDRHRREATALAWVVPPTVIIQPYAYCGTNLLTEWAPQSLHQALDELKSRSSSPTSNHTTMGRLQQQQQQQKFQWALEAATSVAALHQINVIHADLQTGQFLLKKDGTLALNDLNRCRFVPYFNGTTTMGNATNDHPHPQESSRTCPVRIPTAPGPWRSPEEYSHHNLTTAMDVYSLGNVLYELWTGNVPFEGVGSNAWKERVLDGTRRTLTTTTTTTTATTTTSRITELDRRFAQLLDACWKVNPHQRITAAHLAKELEELVRLSHQQEPQEQ
jgi:Protein kinase domain